MAIDTDKRAELVETVVATGSVQTPFRVTIASQITGTVAEASVDEGQRVQAGQVPVLLRRAGIARRRRPGQGGRSRSRI